MKKFEIGQRVLIVGNDAAYDFNLFTLGLVGEVFTVDELEDDSIIRAEHIGKCAVYQGFYIPPAACELVGSEINHSEMVSALAKPGEDILASLTPEGVHAWHMATGVSGEAGELLDAVKKYVVYNKDLDRVNVVEELGDLEFYMEGLRQGLGITREETIEANIAKLGVRYAGMKYTDQAAQQRADKAGEN